jgi:hypothetical protein
MRLIFLFLFIIPVFAGSARTISDAEKILDLQITASGIIHSGADTIAQDKLADWVKNRLFKSWVGNGKIYTKIKFSGADKVNPIISEAIIKEIREGQRLALIAFSLELYRTNFENLDPKKQEKFKNKYPVLFQESFF